MSRSKIAPELNRPMFQFINAVRVCLDVVTRSSVWSIARCSSVSMGWHRTTCLLCATLYPDSRLPGRQNLRSANRGQLDVPRATLSSCGVRAFAHAGPSPWNTLPVHPKNRNLTLTTFMRHLKSYLFSQYWFRIERVWGVITWTRYMNSLLLTYL